MANKDYYNLLGLQHGASTDEIKKAFHKLAHKYHPDKKGGDEVKFKEINEAYQVLSDEQKRRAYDTHGAGWNSADGGPSQGAGGWDFSDFTNAAGQGQGFQFDLGDLFGEFFNGNGGGRSGGRRGRDISVDIQIPFADAIFGSERTVLISKVGICDHCKGTGGEPGVGLKKCATCNGQGKVHETRRSFLGSFTSARECSNCLGRGEVPEQRCSVCGGHGVIKRNEEVKIGIPAGIQNGEMIRLTGRGEAVARGTLGDLYVKVHVEKHKIFQRDGENLVMALAVKLSDALLGAEYKVDTLDGPLTVKIPEGVSPGEILRVRGRGVPTSSGRRGDLYLKVSINLPPKLSRKSRQLIEDLRKEGL